jgi:release factor glutamine methyltransferase
MRAQITAKILEALTIGEALRRARIALRASDTSDLDAQTLLARVLKVNRAFLFSHFEHPLTDKQFATFQSAVERRAAGEPIAYIVGSKGFYDLDLLVSPAVLIPRPETELLLEEALRLIDCRGTGIVADIGTGSGALAVTFARHRGAASVYATEICADALAIARGNAEGSGVSMTLFQGDLASPLIERGIRVDLLMANLPYVASDELDRLAVSRFEPRLALDGGGDGLDPIRRLLGQIPAACRAGAPVLLEIGASQGDAVAQLVNHRLGLDCAILKDYAGLDRIARFRVPV